MSIAEVLFGRQRLQRARMIALLAEGEMNVGEIAGKLNIGSSTISVHTKSLEKAGLIEISRREEQKHYD